MSPAICFCLFLFSALYLCLVFLSSCLLRTTQSSTIASFWAFVGVTLLLSLLLVSMLVWYRIRCGTYWNIRVQNTKEEQVRNLWKEYGSECSKGKMEWNKLIRFETHWENNKVRNQKKCTWIWNLKKHQGVEPKQIIYIWNQRKFFNWKNTKIRVTNIGLVLCRGRKVLFWRGCERYSN